jgi:hypothetical protein
MSQQWLITGSICGHPDQLVTGDVTKAVEILEEKGFREMELQQSARRRLKPNVTARISSDGILRVC